MYQKVKGFRDIFGVEAEYFQYVENIAVETFKNFGYSEIKIPILEKVEVFDRGIGNTTDIVEKEMFVFQDRNEDLLALRPEGTASVVRAFIENKLYNPPGIKKYYYYGPMFRRERPQKGRYRQFYQFGVELFGSTSPITDADVINLLYVFFEKCGVNDLLRLEINSIGCPVCRPQYKEKLISFFADKKDNLCPDCKRRLATNPLRILDCKNRECSEITKDAPLMIEHLCDNCNAHFEKTKEYLGYFGIKYLVNPKIVRGLDYYVRTAFEMVTDMLGASSAVGAGGRYDGLVKTLGGGDIPGIGFAIGVDRLVNIMMQKGVEIKQPFKLFCVIFNEDQLKFILPVIHSLRAKGVALEFDYELSSVKSQMKKADKSKARYTVIFGEEELSKNQVTVKDMENSNQFLIDLDKLENFITSCQA